MIPTPDVQPATPSDVPSSRLAAYFDAELDYVIANFPVISVGFRSNLRRIAVLTYTALMQDRSNPQATRAGQAADLLLVRVLLEWPAIDVEKIADFTAWYLDAFFNFNLTPAEHRTLLEL